MIRPKNYYLDLYDSMVILNDQTWKDRISWYMNKLKKNRERYENCPRPKGVPWFFIATIHMMEASGSFKNTIADGSSLPERVTWEDDTFNQLVKEGLRNTVIKNINDFGYEAEKWNGFGYALKGINSPYIFSGSNHGVGVGKYVSDGKYDATAISSQLGILVMVKKWIEINNYQWEKSGFETFEVVKEPFQETKKEEEPEGIKKPETSEVIEPEENSIKKLIRNFFNYFRFWG